MKIIIERLLAGIAALLLAIPGIAHAEWPNDKPLTIVVPYPPGGVTDQLARLVAKELSTSLGQSVIVQNRAGAGGLIGARSAAQAAPDGYTLLLSQIASHGSLPALQKNLGYDPNKSFTPVILLAAHPLVLAGNPKRPVGNAGELLKLAKVRPGSLNYASAGIGTTFFLSAELLKATGNVFITPIHYQGGAPAVLATLSGETDIVFSDFATALPHIKSGALRGLGVTSKVRSQATPDIPSISETPGLADFEVLSWISLHYPAGVPDAIVQRVNAEANKILKTPALQEWVTGGGGMVRGGTPADLQKHVDSELAKWKQLIQRVGIKAE